MGEDSNDTAAARLRHLTQYCREHPITSAEGHSYISSAPRATVTAPGLPFNVRVMEHVARSVAEVVAHTRTVNPGAEPPPDDILNVYRWYVENTLHAPEAEQQRRDILQDRHRLEHAIEAGDTSVIRPHRCPACGAPGLFWQQDIRKAMCVNRHCARRNEGLHRTYTLDQLAYEEVTTRKNLRQVRAT